MCCLAITIITAIIIYLSACLFCLILLIELFVLIIFSITKTRFTYEHCTVTHSICSTLFHSLFFSFVRGIVNKKDKKIIVSIVVGSALDHLRPKPQTPPGPNGGVGSMFGACALWPPLLWPPTTGCS